MPILFLFHFYIFKVIAKVKSFKLQVHVCFSTVSRRLSKNLSLSSNFVCNSFVFKATSAHTHKGSRFKRKKKLTCWDHKMNRVYTLRNFRLDTKKSTYTVY